MRDKIEPINNLPKAQQSMMITKSMKWTQRRTEDIVTFCRPRHVPALTATNCTWQQKPTLYLEYGNISAAFISECKNRRYKWRQSMGTKDCEAVDQTANSKEYMRASS